MEINPTIVSAIIGFLGVVTVAIISALVTLRVALRGQKAEEPKSGSETILNLQEALDNEVKNRISAEKERKLELENWEKKYQTIESRMQELEHSQAGPYILQTETEFVTMPVPQVIRQSHELKLVPLKKEVATA